MPRNQVPEQSPRTVYATEDEYRICIGRFEGVVHPQGDRYCFSVRDTTRERLTIHGFGVDFDKAVTAVEELLDLLAGDGDERRDAESKQSANSILPPDEETKSIA